MNIHEQRMCELQAEMFELSSDAFCCGSQYFISRFMQSGLAKDLDYLDDPYNFTSPNNIITIMRSNYPSLNEKKGEKYPKSVLKWIGYVYRAWAIIQNKASIDIYKLMKAEDLLSLYDSFHTFSIDYCIVRLEEIIAKKKTPIMDDYEIFKAIMKS